MKRLAPLLVLTAAVLWGANGLFVAPLQDAGLSGTQITCARFISAATGAFAICAAKRCSLRIGSLRDATWFALNGVAGVFLFGLFYTYAIQATGMATAAVLIYLMPSFVMAFSVFTRREPCTARKVLCLAMSLLGCALVSGVAAPGASVAPVGVLFGVLAALFYACNNIVQAGRSRATSRRPCPRGPCCSAPLLPQCTLGSAASSRVWRRSSPPGRTRWASTSSTAWCAAW